jgi:hypothetical protein
MNSACSLRFRIECSSGINAQQSISTMTNNVTQGIYNTVSNTKTNNTSKNYVLNTTTNGIRSV